MIRFSGTIYYVDGREEPYEAGGALLAEWEPWATRHGYPLIPSPETLSTFPVKTWQMFLAYASSTREEGFDVWRKSVLDVDSTDEPELVPPTLPDLSVEA